MLPVFDSFNPLPFPICDIRLVEYNVVHLDRNFIFQHTFGNEFHCFEAILVSERPLIQHNQIVNLSGDSLLSLDK